MEQEEIKAPKGKKKYQKKPKNLSRSRKLDNSKTDEDEELEEGGLNSNKSVALIREKSPSKSNMDMLLK